MDGLYLQCMEGYDTPREAVMLRRRQDQRRQSESTA